MNSAFLPVNSHHSPLRRPLTTGKLQGEIEKQRAMTTASVLKPLSNIILRIRTWRESKFIGSPDFPVFWWCAFLRTRQSYKQALLSNSTKSKSMKGWNNGGQGQGDGRAGRNGCSGSGRKGRGAGYSSQGKPKSTKVGLCN